MGILPKRLARIDGPTRHGLEARATISDRHHAYAFAAFSIKKKRLSPLSLVAPTNSFTNVPFRSAQNHDENPLGSGFTEIMVPSIRESTDGTRMG